jgi:S-(hydroxymethyl)mycothiol dehydrogenase
MAERGVVLSEPGVVALEEIRVDQPGLGEVLVRIEATGVCHTDQHVIDEDGWGHAFPVLLGHEGAATVVAVGESAGDGDVQLHHLVPGDRVVLGWKTACGNCIACRRGEERQCKKPPAALERLHRADGSALTPVLRTGTFATHTVVPQVAAVKVPRELPPEQACLIGCAVATGVMSVLETAKVWEGARVAVIGCGAVGLSVIQGARIAGASEIRALDHDERKLEQATRFGATHTEPGPVDFAFDVVGRRSTFEQALGLLVSGGTVVLIGLSPAGEKAELDLPTLFSKRTRILVSHGGDHLPQEDFPRLARWALEGKLDLAGMVTRTAPLEGWDDALAAMKSGDVIRTVLTP